MSESTHISAPNLPDVVLRPGKRWVHFRRGIHHILVVVLRKQPHHGHSHDHKQHDNETSDAASEGHDNCTFLPTETLDREGCGEKCDCGAM